MIPNKELADRKGLTNQQYEQLCKVYSYMASVLTRPEMFSRNNDEVVGLIKGLEFAMQAIWGFDLDENMHSYWKYVKGCTCPKDDNEDVMFAGRRVVNTDCPFHGGVK